MKNVFLAAAALLAVCPPAAHAQDAAPAAARPVTLRLKFTPGQTQYYKMTTDMDAATLNGPSGSTKRERMHVQAQMHQAVQAIRAPDGAATMVVGFDALSTTVNGKTSPVPPELRAQMKTIGTMVILPDGEALSYTPSGDNGPTINLSAAFPKNMNPVGLLCQFPAAPVRVGDTWKGTAPMGMMGTQAVRFTLSALDTVGGRTVALIQITAQGSFDSAAAQGRAARRNSLRIKNANSEQGALHFDVDAGAVMDETLRSVSTMTMTPPGPDAPIRMHAKTDLTLTRVPAPAPAATLVR